MVLHGWFVKWFLYVLSPTALNSSKQVAMDQFNYSQKSYDRLVHNKFTIVHLAFYFLIFFNFSWIIFFFF